MTQTTVATAVITKAIHLACRAPSLHNSQPWRWVVEQGAVDLFADHRRFIRSTDGSGREAVISCGAALGHFRAAMAGVGWSTTVDRFPNPGNPDHLARIFFEPARYVTDAARDRAAAITRRRTDRLPMQAPENWDAVESVLRGCIDAHQATFEVVSDEARSQLVEAARLTEATRRYDQSYHDELRWWTEPFHSYMGVPPEALVSETERARVGINRAFPGTGHTERRPEAPADEAKVLVLFTPGNTRADALHCGEALSTVLLECTMAGLATCTLTHLTELPETRELIQHLTTSRAYPQAMIRVGKAPVCEQAPSPTPRRPMSEVLEIRR